MKTKTLLVVALLSIVVLAAVVTYGLQEIKNRNELASTLQNQSDDLTEANQLAQSIKTTREKAAGNLSALDEVTITQSELVPFIELVEDIGKKLGLELTITSVDSESVKPSASASSTGFQAPQPIHISIDTKGNWAGSFGFIHALENLPQRVRVDSAEMDVAQLVSAPNSTSTEVTSTGKWHTRSTITIYSFNE
ncbi:hypothetical protein KW785_03365 [Candidatus Parcubacteria bacterium]|nr:hypothetical protein [Candidatus Parcubacteria bacterium]